MGTLIKMLMAAKQFLAYFEQQTSQDSFNLNMILDNGFVTVSFGLCVRPCLAL